MFDIGFLELVLVAVIALLVLGPERLPGAARSAGLWFGKIRRMTAQFTSEIDKQLKAEEFREKLRKEGDTLGVEHIQGTVRQALDRAKDFQDSIVSQPIAGTEALTLSPASHGPAAVAAAQPLDAEPAQTSIQTSAMPAESTPPSKSDETNAEQTKQS